MTIVLSAALLSATATPIFSRETVHAEKPVLSMIQARAIALRHAPGRIQNAEHEQENGGWRYSFDIVQGHRIHEIGVDDRTGRIVEDAFEPSGGKD